MDETEKDREGGRRGEGGRDRGRQREKKEGEETI